MTTGQKLVYGCIFKRHHKKLVKLLFNASCVIVSGDRGTGKSALFCVADEIFENVISNYPTTFSRQLPTNIIRGKAVFDKDLLYSLDTYKTCVLLDEARTIYPARGYAKWTEEDDSFFNFLRKRESAVWLATQAYDCVDLNVKRAADYSLFLTKTMFPHVARVEVTRTTLAKVADKNTELVGRGVRKGLRRVTFEICEQLVTDKLFLYLPKFFNMYVTNYYIAADKVPIDTLLYWQDVLAQEVNDAFSEDPHRD